MIVLKMGDNHNHMNHKEMYVKNEGELASIEDCAPGSVAMTYDMSKVWILTEDGEWQLT